MPRHFTKTKVCGCVVKTILCGIETKEDGKEMYLLGGHTHLTICSDCEKYEECEEDTLHDMWTNDNVTDNFGYAEWKEQFNK